MSKTHLYVLIHAREDVDGEHVKVLGVYQSESAAQAEIEVLRGLPGFCDSPDNFQVEEYILGVGWWKEGFHTHRYREDN